MYMNKLHLHLLASINPTEIAVVIGMRGLFGHVDSDEMADVLNR